MMDIPREEAVEEPLWAADIRGIASHVEQVQELLKSELTTQQLTDALYEACDRKESSLQALLRLILSEHLEEMLGKANLTDTEVAELQKALDAFRDDELMKRRFFEAVYPMMVTDMAGANQWNTWEAEPMLLLKGRIPALEVAVYTGKDELLFRTTESVAGFTANAIGLLRSIAQAYELFAENDVPLYDFYRIKEERALAGGLQYLIRIAEALGLDFDKILEEVGQEDKNEEAPD